MATRQEVKCLERQVMALAILKVESETRAKQDLLRVHSEANEAEEMLRVARGEAIVAKIQVNRMRAGVAQVVQA